MVVGNKCLCHGYDSVVNNVLCCTDMVVVTSKRDALLFSVNECTDPQSKKKIFLTGTCWYEVKGLWHLLSAQGYDVYHELPKYPCPADFPDLIIVALSAEPVAGWGRHLLWIRELREQMSGKMLILVPERLGALKALRNISPVCSGRRSLQGLTGVVRMAIKRKSESTGRFSLTPGQRQALKYLSERGRDKPLNLRGCERRLYWHYARLAETVGVRDFRMMLIAGLDKDIREMEFRQHDE